jgi:hypothetical protein
MPERIARKVDRKSFAKAGVAMLVAALGGAAVQDRALAAVNYNLGPFTVDRSLNAQNSTLNELANVLATHLDDHNKNQWRSR